MHMYDIKDRVFNTLLLFIMIFALSMGMKDYFGIGISFKNLVLYDFILTIAVTLFYCFTRIFALGILISIITAILIKYYNSQLFNKMYSDIYLFFQWLPGYIAGYALLTEGYVFPIFAIIMIFYAGVLAILVFSKINKLIITVIGIIAFSFLWFIYVEKARLYLMIYLFSSLILHSYYLWEKKKKEWKRRNINVSISFYRSWLGSAALLVGFPIMLILMLPLNIRPLKVTALNNFMVRNFPFIEQWKNVSEQNYGYSFAFSLTNEIYKGKKLGGPVNFNGSLMLTLKGSLKNNLYLRGSVYDKYSGFNWSKSRKTLELYEGEIKTNLPANAKLNEFEIEIKPESLNASTLFNPLYPVKIEYNKGKVFVNEDLEIYAQKLIDNKISYKIKSRIALLSEDMLRAGKYSDRNINNLYLKLPQNISKRVKNLVEELCKGKSNSYDKAKSIEAYLRKNHSYTLEPEKVPDGKDFVDYFLFENKEGYCIYYASSMAVMLRLAGIPSRYVEGFVVKSEGQGVKAYQLLDNNAHAWVEAYMGENGWITFEPTPAYEQIQPWMSWVGESTYEYIQSNSDTLPSFFEGTFNTPAISENVIEEDTDIGEYIAIKTNNKGAIIRIIIYILIILVSLRIIYGYIRTNIFKFITLKDSKKYVILYIKQIIWLLSRINLNKNDSETFRELLNRIGIDMAFEANSYKQIIPIIEGILYGGKALSAQDANELKKFTQSLKDNIKGSLGMPKYIWNFYLSEQKK